MAKKLKIEKSKKREKWNLFGAESKSIDKAMLTGPRIELFSNSQMILEGCLGVYEYNDNYLKLRLNNGALVLEGEGFDIVSFEEKNITIKGKISSLEFAV